MDSIRGRRMLVVGGAGRVGRHIVRALLSFGAGVVVPSRDPKRLDDLARIASPGRPGALEPIHGDMTDPGDARRMLGQMGPVDGAVASLGGFVAAPSVLEAPRRDLAAVLENYLFAHHAVAQAVLPGMKSRGGAYVLINGPLAFQPMMPGTGLVSVATAAQAMLARVLMVETAPSSVRVNELVIHSSFGWGSDDQNTVTGADIGRYVAYLLSDQGAGVRSETIHLRSTELIPSAFARMTVPDAPDPAPMDGGIPGDP